MRRKIVSALMALITVSAVQAEHWSVYAPNFSFVNDQFNAKITFPGAVKSAALPDGRILVVPERSLPVIINNKNGSISSELNAFFTAQATFKPNYTPSGKTNIFSAANGDIYLQSSKSAVYFDVAKKEWQSLLKDGSSSDGVQYSELYYVAADKSGNKIINGISPYNNKVFIAVQSPTSPNWEMLEGAGTGIRITSAASDNDGTLWFASSSGLWALKDGSRVLSNEFQGTVKDIQFYNGAVFFSTDEGVRKIIPNTKGAELVFSQPVGSFLVDKTGIWYTQSGALLKRYDFTASKEMTYTKDNVPFSNAVVDIATNGKDVYFSTGNGFYVLNVTDMSKYPNWTMYSPGYLNEKDFAQKAHIDLYKTGKNEAIVVAGGPRTNRWVGKYADGAWTYQPFNPVKEASTFGIVGTIPSCIAQSNQGIFVGTQNDGLLQYDFETGIAQEVTGYDMKIFGNKIEDLAADKDGNLWIAANKGLIKYDGNSFTLYDKKNSKFLSNSANVLRYVPETNMLWIGSDDGVFTFDGTNWTQYDKKQGLSSNNVVCLVVSGNKVYVGGLTMGSTQTLSIIDNGVVSQEKAPAYFHRIAVDDNGTLWLSGSKELMHKKGNEPITMYPSGKIPFSLSSSSSMRYCFNNELFFYKSKDSTFGITSNTPEEEVAKQHKGKINTFDKEIVFMFKVDQ